MLRSTRFPRLQAVVWFDLDKEKDWRLTSSPNVAKAFRTARTTAAPAVQAAAPRTAVQRRIARLPWRSAARRAR
jgi:hypothetical protein